jgi:hypothetical protein
MWTQAPQQRWNLLVLPDEEILGTNAPMGQANEVTTLTSRSLLRLTISPSPPGKDQKNHQVKAFLRRDGRALERWDVHLDRSAQGVFMLRTPLRDLGLSEGRYQITFAIGLANTALPPGQVDEAQRNKLDHIGRDWWLKHHQLIITK